MTMSPDLIEDHNLLLLQIIAALSVERGFIVLRNPATGSPSEFIVTYNFDLERYTRAFGESVSSGHDEYHHLVHILSDLMGHDQPVLTHNMAELKFHGSILPWALRYVIAIPLKDNAGIYGLLWCDRKLIPRHWAQDDLAQAVLLVDQFFSRA
jgi:hypothetical protein